MKKFDQLKVSEALNAFYVDQKLDQDLAKNLINYYPLGFIKVPFINLQARKNLLHLHDLNHILLGFDTTLKGEAQLAAMELGSGFPKPHRIGYLYSPFALLPGLILCPLKVFQAFQEGMRTKNACHVKMTKAELLNSTVIDVRNLLNLARHT